MTKKEPVSWRRRLRSLVLRRIPILRWIKNYSREDAVSDLVAGITISLTMIPQSIAYASLANLSPKTGLNSAFMGCFIYVFFGTIKEVVIGPTSLMALLTYEYTHDYNLDFVVLLCFLCGLVELLMGLLRLGFLVEFISAPVVSGFTTATAIIIVASQIKGIMGVRFKAKGFVDILSHLVERINKFQTGDVVLGVSCIASLLLLRMLKDIKVSEKKVGGKILNKIMWLLSTGRNALAVVVTSYIALRYEQAGSVPFLTTSEVEEGLPSLQFPPTSTSIVVNSTYTQEYELMDMVQGLGMGIVFLPIVSVLANVAIAKAYADDSLDGTQEMLTLALCNIFGSLVQSMPTCGAFTRSAVISASGVRTPLAGLYSAGLTLMALKYLAAYFHLIPRATLSAILISAVIFLIDWRIFKPLWKSCKRDFMVLVLTLISCLCFGVEIGLLLGIVAGIGHLVYLWSRPKLDCQHHQKGSVSYVMVSPKLGLFYPSMSFLHEEVLKISVEHDTVPIVLNCYNLSGIDYTAVKSLHNLSKALAKRDQRLSFVNVPNNFIHIWKSSSCGKLDLLSSEDIEQQLGGGAVSKEEIDGKSATLSIFKESDIKLSAHETIDLLKKEKDIQ